MSDDFSNRPRTKFSRSKNFHFGCELQRLSLVRFVILIKSKPDGNQWTSEDEMWDCRIAFAGSEPEDKRVCQTMEAVFRLLSEEFCQEYNTI
jgi:hypothetical protein